MTSITINLPATFTISDRAGNPVTVTSESLTPAIVEKLVEHGVTQTVNDAASAALAVAYEDETGLSGKDVDKDTRKAWGRANQEAVDAVRLELRTERAAVLESGAWGTTRTTGTRIDPMISARRSVVREMLSRDKTGAANAAYLAIVMADKKAQAEARNAFVDTLAAKNAAVVDPAAQTLIDSANEKPRVALAL